MSPLPIIQYRPRAGILDLSWGHPHPDALPVAAWADAYGRALHRWGATALTYGHAAGPGPLVGWLRERTGREPVFVTAGASQALNLVASVLVRPGDVVLVQSPTYHLALKILRDHSESLVAVPADAGGVDPVATEDLIRRLRRDGRRVPLLYCVPMFANPTGLTMAADRRGELAEVADRTGVCLVEDNTYQDLAYDAPAPPWLGEVGENVARIGSFSKTVAPGLRLGWLTGSGAMLDALAGLGLVDSGGGLNHATALAMADFCASGAYDAHLGQIRSRYRTQRDTLVSALRRHLPMAAFTVPGGGWFLWLRLPAGVSDAELLARAEEYEVSFLTGRQFHTGDPDERYLRLSFSLLTGADLTRAARGLGSAWPISNGDVPVDGRRIEQPPPD